MKTSIAGQFVQEVIVTAEQPRYAVLAYALLSLGLGGAQIAEADCDPSGVPTIDSRSPATASLRWRDHVDDDGTPNRVNEPSATSTVENNFGMIAVHLGTGQMTSAVGIRALHTKTPWRSAQRPYKRRGCIAHPFDASMRRKQ